VTNRSDRQGKRALFEVEPIEIEDSLRDEPLVERHDVQGHEALYSAGQHEQGTAVLTCSACDVRTRLTYVELAVRILALSVWIPGRSFSRHMQCPACQSRNWCRVEWLG
jgi:hypothetical protein